MPEAELSAERLAIFSWALFLVLVVSTILIASAVPFGPITALAAVCMAIFAYRFPYTTLYLSIALTPSLGLMLSLPTGAMLIGQRAFGGSIDVSLAEVVLLFALLGWALKLLVLWWRRRVEEWRPRLPMLLPAAGMVFAHLISALSPLVPDPLLVLKFSLRPVLLDYLVFVALPVNYLRSRKRLVAALGAFAVVATIAAFTGLVAMFFPGDQSSFIGRARPLPLFGISALGENHNELADLLVVTAPLTLALALLMRERRYARVWAWSAAIQALVALLTFARTAWIVVALQVAFLAYWPFRRQFRKHLASLSVVAVLLLPLALAMAAYSISPTAKSSNSTRLMLSEIAYQLYRSSPIFGAGAGTFLDHVGSTQVFLIEYGAPLDSHGWLQKIMAETGSIGLLALTMFLGTFAWLCLKGYRGLKTDKRAQTMALFIASAWGGIIYQFFNTDYWTGKMWLPIGFALAAAFVLPKLEQEGDSRDPGARDILEA